MNGLSRAWAATRRPVRTEWLALLAALFFALACNTAFWHAFSVAGGWEGRDAWRLALALFTGMVALHTALLVLILNRYTTRIVLPVLLLVTAAGVYYMNQYQVYLDADMVRNVLATERKESTELLTPGLLGTMLLLGVLPSILVWRLQPTQRSAARGTLAHGLAFVLAVVVAAGSIAAGYQPLAAFLRNEKAIRHLIAPGNWLVALATVVFADAESDGPKTVVAADARVVRPDGARPRLLLLVIGETVRAQNWGLNGYARQTTPQLAKLDGVNYSDVTACGTNTEVSVPCLFSRQGLAHYDRRAIRHSESLLHVLNRAGIATLWRDNQTGCKGVCSDLPFESFLDARVPGFCDSERCLDAVMLHDLPQRVARMPGDAVIVLHLLGNHGPAYFKRYPPAMRRYLPECTQLQLADCDRLAIVNSYDNAILYTDAVLARAAAWLQAESSRRDTALLFVSDHGESLGEGGLYLHGVPRAIAPDTQLKVPMWLWLSPALRQADGVDMACLRSGSRRAQTHDAVFDTVLGLLRVHTQSYVAGQDLLRGCRAGSGGAA